jgi:DNA-binding NarL/FixJ family response regulator
MNEKVTAPVKLMLVDDHQLVRQGIQRVLQEASEIQIVAQASDGIEAIEILATLPVDVVLMDIDMPRMTGVEATGIIKERFPEVKVIALTMLDESRFISQMVANGARGYLLKKSSSEELITAILDVAQGKQYFSQQILNLFMQGMRNNTNAEDAVPRVQFSKRELEVLKLIAGGKTNEQVAQMLEISARTVETHRRNILQKSGVKNTAALVKYAMSRGLIS